MPLNVQGIEPSPTPWSVSVGHIELPGQDPVSGEVKMVALVQVILSDPTGVKIQFWEPEQAEKVANDIRNHAAMARTGLHLPGGQGIIKAVEAPEDGKRPENGNRN